MSAVYDWDSLRLMREPALVGSVAHMFTADWGVPGRRQLPTLEEALAFRSDYEAARGKAFSDEEERALLAALTYSMGYTARCEHADLLSDFGRHAPVTPEPRRYLPEPQEHSLRRAHAAELLDTALGALPTVEPAAQD